MHPRDLHVAPEGDRADAVLDAVPLLLRDRGREADVEAAGPHADREGREEMARLVDQDQEREAEDGDDDRHRTASPRSASRRAARVGLDQVGEITRGRAVDVGERLLDRLGDPEERQPPLEERGDGDLVRGVERARVGAAPLAGAAREGEQRKRLEVGRLELEHEAGGQVEPRHRRRRALRIGERERDRDAHVGVAEVRERGAVAEAHERVDDRRGLHDDLDPLVRQSEEEVRLDQLEPLVGERRGVDRDLRAHAPRRVRERLLGRDVLELVALAPAEGAAGAGQDERLDRAAHVPRGTGTPPSARCRPAAAALLPAPAPRAPARPRRRGSPCSRARA